VYLLFAITLMVLLHFMMPVAQLFWWPWNLTGIAPVLVGVALNIVAANQFKRRKTTVKPFQPSSALVTDGVFRISRNPMYLGMACILIGLGICLASLTPLIVIPLFVWSTTRRFIVPEEEALAEQFRASVQGLPNPSKTVVMMAQCPSADGSCSSQPFWSAVVFRRLLLL
jgi:protein-S-isoprenylcysteine O-methyltransferase Ste14